METAVGGHRKVDRSETSDAFGLAKLFPPRPFDVTSGTQMWDYTPKMVPQLQNLGITQERQKTDNKKIEAREVADMVTRLYGLLQGTEFKRSDSFPGYDSIYYKGWMALSPCGPTAEPKKDQQSPRTAYHSQESPFAHLDEKRDPINRTRVVIDQFRHDLHSPIAARFAERLLELSEPDESGDEPLKPESIGGFYIFLAENPKVRMPEISMTTSGNIYARWRESENRKFSIEFLSSSSARFALFTPVNSHSALTAKIAGTDSPEMIVDRLQKYSVVGLLGITP